MSDEEWPSSARYAVSERDAEARYMRWCEDDPFPDVPPALLNSGDIRDYVAETGMLHPFVDDNELLKPASYEVAIEGPYIYWDAENLEHRGVITDGKSLVLEPNSIAFVTVQPTFRLPAYMAVRFNLKITHVYRGLLLGTKPLVDPGFRGKLSIPLHNLTTNDYELRHGHGLIWMEFTKLSRDRLKQPLSVPKKRSGTVTPLPAEKKNHDVYYYVAKASPHRPVRSSIPEVTNEANAAARRATNLTRFGLIGLIVGVATFFGVLWQALAVVRDANEALEGQREQIILLEQSVEDLKEQAETMGDDIVAPPGEEPAGTPQE